MIAPAPAHSQARRWLMLTQLSALCLLVGIAGCRVSSKPSAAITDAASPQASRSLQASVSLQVSVSPAPSSPASSAPASFPQTPTSGEFLSPSSNISCEIDSGQTGLADQTYCQTVSPAQSVTMSSSDSVTTCAGVGCLGDPAEDASTLAYGKAVGLGGFRCTSAANGVSCTVSGRGFEISRTGITPIGTPVVNLGPGTYHGTVDSVGTSNMIYTIASGGCGAAPTSGKWTVDLKGAVFVANSEPSTGQGRAVTVAVAQWAAEVQKLPAWDVVVASGQPTEITDGPTTC